MLLYLLEIANYAFLVLLRFFFLLIRVFVFLLRGLFRVSSGLALATLRLLIDAFLPRGFLTPCASNLKRRTAAVRSAKSSSSSDGLLAGPFVSTKFNDIRNL